MATSVSVQEKFEFQGDFLVFDVEILKRTKEEDFKLKFSWRIIASKGIVCLDISLNRISTEIPKTRRDKTNFYVFWETFRKSTDDSRDIALSSLARREAKIFFRLKILNQK